MKIPNYTDEQKIAKFNEIQEASLEQDNWNEEEDGENDEHYFVESVISITLGK